MVLATLSGTNKTCSTCKGDCSECKSLAPLQGWFSDAVSWTSDTVGSAVDYVSTPFERLGSTLADIGSGNFEKAWHDAGRTVDSPGFTLAVSMSAIAATGGLSALISSPYISTQVASAITGIDSPEKLAAVLEDPEKALQIAKAILSSDKTTSAQKASAQSIIDSNKSSGFGWFAAIGAGLSFLL